MRSFEGSEVAVVEADELPSWRRQPSIAKQAYACRSGHEATLRWPHWAGYKRIHESCIHISETFKPPEAARSAASPPTLSWLRPVTARNPCNRYSC